jgi:two-component system sensor histidine kinase and response regulator WspE
MNASSPGFGDAEIFALFRREADSTLAILSAGVLVLEKGAPSNDGQLDALMRAAHSLKGAARIVGAHAAVRIAHTIEDIFVAAQKNPTTIGRVQCDHLLGAIDLLRQIAHTPESAISTWDSEHSGVVDRAIAELIQPDATPPAPKSQMPVAPPAPLVPPTDGFVRVSTDTLNRLFALVSETQVEARWLPSFGSQLGRLRRLQREMAANLSSVRARRTQNPQRWNDQSLASFQTRLDQFGMQLQERLAELENFESRMTSLAERLHREAVVIRMRPLADSVTGFPRMVRDLARQLGKEIHFDVAGAETPVDREVLEKLETLIGHLLRNAIDHGIEFPKQRTALGKPSVGVIRLQARQQAGRLLLIVSDDGNGVDAELIRKTVVERGLADPTTAARLRDDELFEFLFLPGFSLRTHVTEISGRGVGLDAVQTMVRSLRGSLKISSRRGQGTTFELQLPLTLAVTRALIFEIAEELYAIPLVAIAGTVCLTVESVSASEGRQHFLHYGQTIGLVSGHQILGHRSPPPPPDRLPIIIVQDSRKSYGLAVDQLLEEREIVVQPLDPRLGKIPDIAAAALLEDGRPILIFDVEDLVRSVEKRSREQALNPIANGQDVPARTKRKRLLVADDSLTVRELQRKLLEAHGYEVEVAVDGMQAWNTVRVRPFDLLISDVDMPRIDGLSLTRLIRADARLRSLPVVIVSYKDREEDRILGLEAGADHYLTKASFQNDTLAQTVDLLLGASRAPAVP